MALGRDGQGRGSERPEQDGPNEGERGTQCEDIHVSGNFHGWPPFQEPGYGEPRRCMTAL
jgi:hypothetical protein